ncbi:MAG: nucleotide exchange factor GrpE [Chloroflexota bacterium]
MPHHREPHQPLDRRTRAQQRADEIDISPTKLLADIERLTGERDAAAREKDEYLAALQRERAEFVNFKRRTAEERQAMLGLAAEGLISKVLALADDFDRAIEARPEALAGDAWADGVAAIDRKLRQLLESEGVSAIEAAPGTPFDPREHEAVASVPGTDRPGGSIVGELRRGYRLRDRVLRPALVAVAAHDDAAAPADDPGPTTDQPIH